MSKLPIDYYLNPDVVFLARDLLGKVLMTNIDAKGLTGGIIVETEAYEGETDRASHAYAGRLTRRTETLYLQGGVAYVYLCYGMHHLFNVVTNTSRIPHAVLIRAIKPVIGHELMSLRNGMDLGKLNRINGPGKLTKALGITQIHNKTLLCNHTIWIEDPEVQQSEKLVIEGPRVGIDYAGEHALWPYRFTLCE